MGKIKLDSFDIVSVDNVYTCPYCGCMETDTIADSFSLDQVERCFDCDREWVVEEL